MSIYEYNYQQPPSERGGPAPSPLRSLLLILIVLVPVIALAYWFWPSKNSPLDPNAKPREITPRSTSLFKDEADLIALYEKVLPSVVHINNLSEQADRFSLNIQQVPRGSGSGFVWDKQGHIVTNYHVVAGASAVQVILWDKSSYTATAMAWDKEKDLAVVTIDAPENKLMPIPLGSSHDLKVGQNAVVIGNPFGLDGSITTGIISALNREIDSLQGVIQTSAPINPGNSGGPLLDSDGRLIGVTTSIISPSGAFAGIGFAIPSDEVNQVVPQLIARGRVFRPRLGVTLARDEDARHQGIDEGALIWTIRPNSPASKAGLRPTRIQGGRYALGDVIVGIDDHPVTSSEDLVKLLQKYSVGDTVTVTYVRNGERHQVQVTLQEVE
jgi:S1-C subfamily serine protease